MKSDLKLLNTLTDDSMQLSQLSKSPIFFSVVFILVLLVVFIKEDSSNSPQYACTNNLKRVTGSREWTFNNQCSVNGSKFHYPSEETPVGGVLVACDQENLASCLDIAEKILTHNPEIKLNVVHSFHKNQPLLWELKQTLSPFSKQNNLNYIAFAQPETTPKYFRDVGLQVWHQKKPFHLSFPYTIEETFIEESVNDLFEQCGIPHKRVEKWTSEFLNESLPFLKPEDFDHLNKNSINSLMGGNYLFLPGNRMIVGMDPDEPSAIGPMPFLKSTLKMSALPLPKLEVNHIDEVFKVFNPSQYKFQILVASPKEMKAFLESVRDTDWNLSEMVREQRLDEIGFNHLKIKAEVKRLSELYKSTSSLVQKKKIERDLLSKLQQQVTIENIHNRTAEDFLKDKKLMKQWQVNQDTIDESFKKLTEYILAENPQSQIERIDIPVFWNLDGTPILPNPINSLYINGNLYYSVPISALFADKIQWPLDPLSDPMLGTHFRYYKTYESWFLRQFNKLDLQNIIGVNTLDYDTGQGNIHCATYTILAPCN